MDPLLLVLLILLLVLFAGGYAWPAPADGHPTWSPVLYLLGTVVLIVLLARLLLAVL